MSHLELRKHYSNLMPGVTEACVLHLPKIAMRPLPTLESDMLVIGGL